MALVNHAKREINAKIVYYGHEGAGKSASLQYVYDRIKPALRGELKSLATGGNTLLFFDFSPFERPVFGGYRLRFHMYSLTGKVANPAAWKMTLKGADGLVVVVDSALDMLPASRETISLLRDFLGAYGGGLHDMPCVIQLNRSGNGPQESAAVTTADLGVPDMPSCSSETPVGAGVLEALSILSREVVARIGQSDALRKPEHDEASGGDEEHCSAGATATPDSGEFMNQTGPAWPHDEMPAMGLEIAGRASQGVLQVSLAGTGAEAVGGVVRVPLEITIGEATRRLVVSISIGPE